MNALDIAVRALEQVLRAGRGTSGRIILDKKDEDAVVKALAAFAAQALPVAQDERSLFESRYYGACFQRREINHPCDYIDPTVESLWDGWKAGRASVAVPAAVAVPASSIKNANAFPPTDPVRVFLRSPEGRKALEDGAAKVRVDITELEKHRSVSADRLNISMGIHESLASAKSPAAQPVGEAVAWEPKFEAIALVQEKLAVELSMEIAGRRGQKPSLPDAARLLEMAEALYIAERDDATIGRKSPPVAQDQDAARMDRQYLAGFDAGFMAGEAGDIDKRTKVHAARDAAMQAKVKP